MMGLNFGTVGFVAAAAYAGTGLTISPTNSQSGINRALQFVAGNMGFANLTMPDVALTGTSWTIRCRVRPDAANGGGYVLSHCNGTVDKAAIIYNFVANTFEFFDSGNSTGAAVRLPLTTPTPPNGSFYDIAFTYDGAVLQGFLNGNLAGSLSSVFRLNTLVTQLVFGQRNNFGGGAASVTIDYLRENEGSVTTVELELNEAAPGPYVNTGSYGSQLAINAPVPTSIIIPTYSIDPSYTGTVAVAGTYGLFSRAETNKTGGWFLYNAAGYPAGVTGGGMINSDPSTGANSDPNSAFEIHFNGTGITLYGYTNQYGFCHGKLDGVPMVGNIHYDGGTGSIVPVYQVSGLTAGPHVFRHYGDPTISTGALIPQYYVITGPSVLNTSFIAA